MLKKISEKPTVLVFQVLDSAAPGFLSISDIISKLYENYGLNCTVHTVSDYVKMLQCTNTAIISRIERRGRTNQPVTVYSILKSL